MQVTKSTVHKTLKDGGVRIRPHSNTPEGLLSYRHRQRPGSNSPFGYAYLDGKFTVHPKEIQVVRRIVQMRLSGISFRAIARTLNAKGLASRSGKKWDHSVISDILHRESDESLKRLRGEL